MRRSPESWVEAVESIDGGTNNGSLGKGRRSAFYTSG